MDYIQNNINVSVWTFLRLMPKNVTGYDIHAQLFAYVRMSQHKLRILTSKWIAHISIQAKLKDKVVQDPINGESLSYFYRGQESGKPEVMFVSFSL